MPATLHSLVQGSAKFSVEGHIINSSGSVSSTVSVAPTAIYPCRMKAVRDKTWLCFHESFTRQQAAGCNRLTVLVHELLLLYYQFMMYESLNQFHAQYASTLCSPPLIVMDFYQQVGR